MALMKFLSRAFPPHELAIQELPGNDARMRVGAWAGILFPMPQRVHVFIRGIKMQDLAKETRFDSVLSLLSVWRLKKLNWAVDGCSRWYHYESRTGVVRGVPAYRRHGREFPNSNPVSRAGVTAWTMENTSEVLDPVRQRPVIRSQPDTWESEEEEGKIAPVRALVPAWGALAVSKERHGLSHTGNSRDLPD